MTRVWQGLDVETVRDDTKVALIPAPVANRTLKDAEKIAADLNAKAAAAVAKTNLDPWTSRPYCIVTATECNEEPRVFLTDTDDALRAALEEVLAQRVSPHGDTRPFLGYNVAFDMAHLRYHALRLGVPWPKLDLRPWSTFDVLDVYREVADDDCEHVLSRSLTSACRAFGVPVPEGGIDGKDVQAALEAGRGDEVVAHCVADVRLTIALARRCRLIVDPQEVSMATQTKRWLEEVRS